MATLERNKWACDTVRRNKDDGHPLVRDWNVFEGDVRAFDWASLTEPVDLVAGGPPCQPFSAGGLGLALDDPRDMFPATAEIVARVRPKAFIIENVRGLTRPRFADYFEYIQLRLAMPTVRARAGEQWTTHLARLRASQGRRGSKESRYDVSVTLVNAADYGVPQQRHRVFIVGFRQDIAVDWTFPAATHSRDALMRDQWVTGKYWEDWRVPVAQRPTVPDRLNVGRYAAVEGSAWRTVREAIHGLPTPVAGGAAQHHNHVLQPGARSYPGHTGSPLDLPSKALKAGGHGVPGGENMLLAPDGAVRYFTVRESARIQTFPDDYKLQGAWGEAMRQLGNAVPVELARIVASSVQSALQNGAPR